jgi:hypothetical protein
MEVMIDRFLLLRPEGGLNDIFCRIFVCHQYCLKTGRTLVIDTFPTAFAQSLEAFLVPIVPNVVLLGNSGRDFINELGPFRPRLKGSINSYATSFDADHGFVCADSGVPLTFDLSVDHPERTLLYHGCGGGGFGVEALNLFQLTEGLRRSVLGCRSKLPTNYSAVHIRYTDMRINLDEFLRKLQLVSTATTLYVATDSILALSKVRSALTPPVEILNFSGDAVSSSHDPVHMFSPSISESADRQAINQATFSDLFCLAQSSEFYFSRTEQGVISGYAILANMLRTNSNLLARLLNLSVYSCRRQAGVML